MTVKEYAAGDVIFEEGAGGNVMCEVLEGSVAAFVGYGNTDEKLLSEMKAGELFGEIALLESIPRSATVVALSEPTKIKVITSKEVGEYFKEAPEQIERILAQLGSRLGSLYQEYSQVEKTLKAYKNQGAEPGLLNHVSKLLSRSLLHPPIPERTPSEAELEACLEQESEEMKYEWEEAVPQKAKRFQAGEVIYSEGQTAENLYFVSKGSVAICQGYGTEEEKLVGKVRETQFFGELNWMEAGPRYHTTVALEEDTRVDLISREDLKVLTEKFPSFVLVILQDFSSQLRLLTGDYLEAVAELDEITREEREKNRYPL